ncbi:hypothetical protein [Paenibacillus thermotolerans]|uniref:hypothetical protein n=1 Tax=Paenibacillus thermotolerans TaxID=3027807 RepID=UPI0023680629|nr:MULTISPECIES: hypothetical protein [unclassified Paenibacillus]
MRELVGECKQCGRAVYCENGFLGGTVLEDGTLLCFDCEDDGSSQEQAGSSEK